MAKYQRKPEIVEAEATQWFKMGDHEDVILNKSDGRQNFIYPCCGYMGDEHGRLLKNGNPVDWVFCPGSWIVTSSTGTYIMSDEVFQEKYEAVE